MEYGIDPVTIRFENRIYQSDDIWVENPEAEDILPIIAKIKEFDKIINEVKLGAAA